MAEPSPAAGPRSNHSFRSARAWVVLLGVLTLGLALDLATKSWSFRSIASEPVILVRQQLLEDPSWNVPQHERVRALPWGLLDFQLVINRGAVFGIGENQRFFFIAFTIAALAAGLLVFAKFTARGQHLAHVAIGLILAGGVGNLYDRIVYGVVRDFLHMLPGYTLPFNMTWPGGSRELFPWVFNLADVMLLSGMGLLLLHMNRLEKRRRIAEARPAAALAAPGAAASESAAPAGLRGDSPDHSDRKGAGA